MSEEIRQYFATDREIFDLLMSGKLKLSDANLRDIARSRGLFYPSETTREELSAAIAVLPHDLLAVQDLMDRLKTPAPTEKTTYRTLDASVNLDEL